MEERVNPITVKDLEKGKEYILDFNRDSVKFAEAQGLNILSFDDKPVTNRELLMWCAFRKNHREVSRADAVAMLDRMGKDTAQEVILRLLALYGQAAQYHYVEADEGEEKNATVTVEL